MSTLPDTEVVEPRGPRLRAVKVVLEPEAEA